MLLTTPHACTPVQPPRTTTPPTQAPTDIHAAARLSRRMWQGGPWSALLESIERCDTAAVSIAMLLGVTPDDTGPSPLVYRARWNACAGSDEHRATMEALMAAGWLVRIELHEGDARRVKTTALLPSTATYGRRGDGAARPADVIVEILPARVGLHA